MLPSMFAGMFIAWLLAASLSAAHIRLAIGLIAALFVLRHWTARTLRALAAQAQRRDRHRVRPIGGVTTMLANAGGPAWQIHLLPQKLEKLPYIGTVSILFAASNVVKIPGFLTSDISRGTISGRIDAGSDCDPGEFRRHLDGAPGLDRNVLSHRLCADFIIAVELIRGSVIDLWCTVMSGPSENGWRRARSRSNSAA